MGMEPVKPNPHTAAGSCIGERHVLWALNKTRLALGVAWIDEFNLWILPTNSELSRPKNPQVTLSGIEPGTYCIVSLCSNQWDMLPPKCPNVIISLNIFDFCRDCFLTYFTHRFRATIGKARLIRDGDKVQLCLLVVFVCAMCDVDAIDLQAS